MRSLSLFIVLLMWLANAQGGTPGTNGAGETRTWTVNGETTFPAEFVKVVDGMVTLSHTESAHVHIRGNGKTVSRTVKQQVPITVGLAISPSRIVAGSRRRIHARRASRRNRRKGQWAPSSQKLGSIASQRSWTRTRRWLSRFTATRLCGVSPSVPGSFST